MRGTSCRGDLICPSLHQSLKRVKLALCFFILFFFPLPSLSDEPGAQPPPSHFFFPLFSKEMWGALAQHPATPASTSSRPSLLANIPIVIAFLGFARSGFASNWQLEVISQVIFSSPVRQPPPRSSPPPLPQEHPHAPPLPHPQRPLVALGDVSPGSNASNLPVKIPPTKERRPGKKWVPPLESAAAPPLR